MAGTTTIQEPVDKVKKVYDAVSKKYDVGTFDEFKADMKDPKKNRKVYDVVSKDFDVGSYDTFQQDLGANGKKKDTGSVSPSASSPKPDQTGQPVNTGGSNRKQVTANFKNNSLTASDVGKVNGDGITPDMVKNAINNNGKNLSDAKNASSNYSSQYLVKQKQDVDAQIDKLSHQTISEMEYGEEAVAEHRQKIEDLKNRSDYLNTELQKNYDYRMQSLVPELVDQIKSSITDDDFSPGLHTLKEKPVQRVASIIDAYLNKENDAVVNARISGDLNNKNRTYEDVTRQVIQQLNFIPIQKAVDEYKKDFSKVHPQFADAFNANDATKDYFSNTNFDDVKSKVEIDAKKSFIETKNRYWGDGGLFMKSKDMVRIQEHYAQLVDDGKMTEEVAKTQMDAEIKQNPALQKLQKNYENDVKKINQNARKQYDQYVIKGLQTKHPQYTIYKDNKIGLASMSEDDFNKLTDEYQKGADDIVKKMGAENNELWKKDANERASNVNWFWSGLGVSMNGLLEGVSKGFFSLTGWGGDNVRHYEAQDIASPSISESDQVLAWNKEGLTAIKHPNYFLFMAGQAAPVVVGGAAVGLATRGAGVPDYIEWLINAGLYTGQSAVGTFSDLAGSRDKNGNIISENDAARVASDQAANDFLPNVVMMGLGSGTVFRAKNIIKPTIAGAIKEGIFGTAATYPLLLWQGTNDYFAVKQAQGYEPDMYDYMQSKDFRDNLMNGLVIGGGMSLLHAPMNLSKNIDNWTKMVHTSEGEFKNLIPQNYALGQEFSGNGHYLRDALKLHIFNTDPEGLNEEGKRNLSDLKNALLYSTNLDRVIRQANLDPKNIKDLYQAHNLALADQHDYLSEQAAKEGNKSLSDIYKDKAKDYREQAKAAANGEAKYRYMINDEGAPIFMSQNSFETLQKEGTIAKWLKDGTVKEVHRSDDPDFAQRYKEFVTAKDQATVEGGDVMDHAEKLIEENKDKLGGWYAVAKEHPDEFYNSVAGLVFGRNSDGSESNVPGNEKSAREQFGNDIVDLAKVLYPITQKEGGPNATTEGQGAQQKSNQPSGEQEHTRTGAPREEETQSRSDRGDSGTDGAGQIAPEDNITVSEMLDKKGTYKGQRGTFIQDGQTVIFRTDDGKREYELGNVNEIGKSGIHEFGIEPEHSVVGISAEGKISVRGKEYVNPNADPLKAIVRDEDGNVVAVKMQTPEGERRTFRGQVAEDLAYQLHLKQLSDANEQPAFEQFINEDEASRKEMDDAGVQATTEDSPAKDNEPVQREKIEPVKEEKPKPNPKKESPKPKESEEPKATPVPEPRQPKESPKEEFASVRKEKLKEIAGAKELLTKRKIPWKKSFNSALKNVMGMYPNKSLFEAMRDRIAHFADMASRGELYAPTHEDHHVFTVFRHELEARLGEIQGWDGDSNFDRVNALAQKAVLDIDRHNLLLAAGEGGSESGRALAALQAEVKVDPDAGLKIRRMDLLAAKGGDKLTDEEMEWSAHQWEKEKAIAEEAAKYTQAKMQDAFNKELSDVRAEYEKKLKEARAARKPDRSEDREKRLSERGKEAADWLRKGKFTKDQAYSVPFPGFTQTVNFVIEGLAQIVEKGSSLAEAIDTFVKEHKIGDRESFSNNLFTLLGKRDRQGETLVKIRKMAEAEGLSDITPDMVSKGLISDYMNDHIGLHAPEKVLDAVHESLKEVLPDLERDNLVKAYLKQDEYAPPTKQELDNSLRQQKRTVDKLASLEKDINDLQQEGELHRQKKGTPFPKQKVIDEKEKELKNLMDSMGIKTTSEDKYTKASYDSRAKSHNSRIEDIKNLVTAKLEAGGLSSATEKVLHRMRSILEDAKAVLDPTSALSQDRTLEGALSDLKSIRSEFKRRTLDDITKVADIDRMMGKAIDKFTTDKEDSEQNIALQRAKDRARQDMDRTAGKLFRKEYEEKPKVVLNKSDAELIALERQRGAIEQEYRNQQRKYNKGQKTWYRRVAEFGRAAMVDWMIGGPMTIAKVLGSAIIRPNMEAATKLSFGKLYQGLPFETTRAITERAMAGGESESLRSIENGYRAYLGALSEDQIKGMYDKANKAYEDADAAYQKAKGTASEKELMKLKNTRDDALISAISSSMYQYIGGNSFKEALEVLLHRSTQMERQFGDFEREDFTKIPKWSEGKMASFLATLDNIQHIANFVGRSHAALKNFSARQSFAAGFMARVEYAVKNGKDVSTPERILEIAHDSYLDWERGKYQESNWVSDRWNQATNAVERTSPELAYLMKADVAITRVPVNILREGVMEYTIGAFRAVTMSAREYYKAKGIVLQDGYTPENEEQFRKELREQLNNIDPKRAATIVRSFRKGGFGLGLYALAAYGAMSFGGWAHKGQTAEDKKKMQRELETGHPELKTSEMQIGNWKMPEFAAKIIEHSSTFAPLGFSLGLVQVYKNNVVDGRMTKEAAFNAIDAQVEHIVNSIPQAELAAYLGGKVVDRLKPSPQWDDVDQDGNPMKRKVFNITDHFKYLHIGTLPWTNVDLHLGDKKNILSESYYKQAVGTQKSYRDQITEVETNTSLSKEEKETQRQALLKQLDEEIDEIYKQNKENPQ